MGECASARLCNLLIVISLVLKCSQFPENEAWHSVFDYFCRSGILNIELKCKAGEAIGVTQQSWNSDV